MPFALPTVESAVENIFLSMDVLKLHNHITEYNGKPVYKIEELPHLDLARPFKENKIFF